MRQRKGLRALAPSKSFLHPLFCASQDVAASPLQSQTRVSFPHAKIDAHQTHHRSPNKHRLTSKLVINWNQWMVRRKCTCRALPQRREPCQRKSVWKILKNSRTPFDEQEVSVASHPPCAPRPALSRCTQKSGREKTFRVRVHLCNVV